MSYQSLAYIHLATVVPAFFIGTLLMLKPKGTGSHRVLGRAFMLLMLATALISLLMPAEVGPQLASHFGFIHLFSLLTLICVPAAWVAIRTGERQRHRRILIGLYSGGLVVAGAFALMPGRLLHGWIFS